MERKSNQQQKTTLCSVVAFLVENVLTFLSSNLINDLLLFMLRILKICGYKHFVMELMVEVPVV